MMISAVGEYTPKEFTTLLDAVDELERDLAETRQQRDTLAEALQRWPEIKEWLKIDPYINGYMKVEGEFFDSIDKALATVKGEKL